MLGLLVNIRSLSGFLKLFQFLEGDALDGHQLWLAQDLNAKNTIGVLREPNASTSRYVKRTRGIRMPPDGTLHVLEILVDLLAEYRCRRLEGAG